MAVDEAGFVDAYGEQPSGDSPMWGALIGAAASAYAADKSDEQANQANAINSAQWHRSHYFGIHDRVADAKKSGVHPLFALGANVGTPPAQQVLSDAPAHLAQAGQHVSRALQAQMNQYQRQQHVANLLALEAQAERDFAHAQLYRSEAARAARAATGSAAMPSDVVVGAYKDPAKGITAHPLYQDAVRLEPDQRVSSSAAFPAASASRDNPGLKEYQVTKNLKMLAPINEEGWSEGLESVPWYMLGHLVTANRQKYGDDWMDRFLLEGAGFGPDTAPYRGIMKLRKYLESLGGWVRRRFE